MAARYCREKRLIQRCWLNAPRRRGAARRRPERAPPARPKRPEALRERNLGCLVGRRSERCPRSPTEVTVSSPGKAQISVRDPLTFKCYDADVMVPKDGMAVCPEEP